MTNKSYGVLLPILLILGIIGSLQQLSVALMKPVPVNLPEWFGAYAVIIALILLAAMIGIGLWKKWGVGLLAVWVVASIVVNLTMLRQGSTNTMTLILIIGAVLWFTALYPRWSQFE